VADVTAEVLAAVDLPGIVRDAVLAWITNECESLYGAPMGDLAANGGFEDYELPGGDHLITSDLGALAEQLADGLDVRCEHRVGSLRHGDGGWAIDDAEPVDAVILTVPIGVLGRRQVQVSPELPADVVAAIDSIGAGPIAKVFATFDEACWPRDRSIRLVGSDTFGVVIDVSVAAGRPTLLAFAVGDAARRVEQLGEHELCRLFDDELRAVGLVDDDRR
jgi:monoamine oxidase